MMALTEKRVLITGASGGIGAAIAQAMSAAGAIVLLTGTREAALQETAAALTGAHHIIPSNLSHADAPQALFSKADALVGGVDILVNNAGITKDTLAMRMSDEDWQQVLEVNLTASFRLARAALKGMMKQRFGRIINITSVVGTMGNAGQGNYCAAKAGLTGFSKALAQEVASRNITVNCIAPGFITTAMTDKLNDAQKQAMLSRIPMGRFGEPTDIAAAAIFLASDGAAYITGQTLHVNGGMVMI